MTNGQAATRKSWLARCFPRAPGFSQSNQYHRGLTISKIEKSILPCNLATLFCPWILYPFPRVALTPPIDLKPYLV